MTQRDERFEHTRRQLIRRFGAAAGVFIAVPLLTKESFAQTPFSFSSDPFQLGIAAGDPAADGFVIWTRLAPKPFEIGFGMGNQPVEVDWEVATDDKFASIVRSGKEVASPLLGHSVHAEVTGLQPDRPYWYRFRAGGVQSPQGKAKTTPVAGAPFGHVKFAVAGCQSFPTGFFSAYKHLVAEEPDFVFCYGDYIYEGGGGNQPVDVSNPLSIRRHFAGEIYSVDDYRRRYAQYKSDADLRAAHAAAAWWPVWDDHETENNWASEWDENGSPPELFRFRRQAAAQAYYENMPLRKASLPVGTSIQIYRRGVYGDLMDLNLLDTRQFRSNQPCNDKAEGCTAVADPKAEFMGRAQEDWLFKGFAASKTRWKCIAQQVMMMDLDRDPSPNAVRYNIDSWAGYQTPRARVLSHIRDKKVSNVVVLTGDEHVNYAGELHVDGRKPGPKPVAVELVSTSITSGGDGQDANDNAKALDANNEQLKFINQQRGYVICDVTKERWETRFRVIDKVTTPGGAISTRKKFVVEPNVSQLTA
ncbi:MAG TPA: alkaline phosphatase D family protein [Hyphomonadaceae bacterium]|jgi:alkaline phosphatase D|nr:alkaline phosphatase D family protein [Hyphomonadaceae bacterium]